MMSASNLLPQVSQNELQAMAYSDPLTGLGNRYRLRDKVRQIAKEREEDPAPFAIGIANLDGFKPINDLFGIEAGDEILCQVAHRLKACMPDGATRLHVLLSAPGGPRVPPSPAPLWKVSPWNGSGS